MAGSAARNTTAGNTMTSYGTPGGAAGMASSIFPTLPASNMQPQFDPSRIRNDFGGPGSTHLQGQPSVGAFEPNLPPGMQGQQFNDAFPKSSNGAPPNVLADPSAASFAGDVMPMAPLAAGKGGGAVGLPAPPGPMQITDGYSIPGTQPVSATLSASAPAATQGQYAPLNAEETKRRADFETDTRTLAGMGPSPAGIPQNPQYAPMAPQGGFNVNQASAGALQQSMQGAQAGMGFQPGQIRPTGYQASTVGAGQLAGKDLDPYTNPYESQVVQQTLSDLGGAQEQQLNQMGAQASAANAFGGSRHGIAEAETRKGFADKATQAVSGLRQAGFTQAQQAAQADINTAQQAAMANMGARNVASQYGAGNQMSSQQQNIANQIAAQNMRMGAGSQLGQLGQQAFNTGQTIQQNQQQQGLMQQGLQQALIDAARGQYAGYTGAPNQALSAPLAALGVTPVPQSTTTSRQPGLFDYLSLGASAYASDVRLKTDITPAGNVGGFNFYNWKWNDEGKRIADPKQPTYGVMADEVKATHPHLVKRGSDGYLRVNYRELMGEMGVA